MPQIPFFRDPHMTLRTSLALEVRCGSRWLHVRVGSGRISILADALPGGWRFRFHRGFHRGCPCFAGTAGTRTHGSSQAAVNQSLVVESGSQVPDGLLAPKHLIVAVGALADRRHQVQVAGAHRPLEMRLPSRMNLIAKVWVTQLKFIAVKDEDCSSMITPLSREIRICVVGQDVPWYGFKIARIPEAGSGSL